MSLHGSISFEWADGTHIFRLAHGQIRELQEKSNAGIIQIFTRIKDGAWYLDDLREVIRLGLIGGGKTPLDALALTVRYVDERPLLESVAPATAILMAALVGSPDDPVGKKKQKCPRGKQTDG